MKPAEDHDFSIVAEAGVSEWTAHTVELAALLARTMASLEEEQRLLRAEGSVTKSSSGSPTAR